MITRLRSFLLALILALIATQWVDAQKTVHVKPYTRKDGTAVKGHDRRAPTKKGATPAPTTTGAATETASDDANETLVDVARPTRATMSGPASQLLGATDARVREVLGMPSLVSNGAWAYDGGRRTLHVYFKGGVVSEVRPTDVDLSTFAPREAAATKEPTPPPLPPPPPEDAVAQCGDGLFVYVATGVKTCVGHGGVAKWLKTPR